MTRLTWTIAVTAIIALTAGFLSAQVDADRVPANKRTSLALYLTPQEAYEAWQKSPDRITIIDSRTPEEYLFVGHATMARNIPVAFLEYRVEEGKNKPVMRPNPKFVDEVRAVAQPEDIVFIMCRSGSRSAKAVNLLAGAGYKKAYSIVEGFEGGIVKDPKSPHFGMRSRDGWRNRNLPWTYKLDPSLIYAPSRERAELRDLKTGILHRWGTLRSILRDGESQTRVDASTLSRKGHYALGALEGLAGEVTILDGKVWASYGDVRKPRTRRGADRKTPATFLVAASVPSWKKISIEKDVPAGEMDRFMASLAQREGFDPELGIPFLIEGTVQNLHVHVIAGECPRRARALGMKMKSPPFEASFKKTEATLLGFYSVGSTGVMTHADSDCHIHALFEGPEPWTGHVDRVDLPAGTVLRIPAATSETSALEKALREALDDEYRSRATYEKVIETFGSIRPFSNIVEAEKRHAARLLTHFEALGLTPPADRWPGKIKAPESFEAACREAAEAEVANIAIYERWLKTIDNKEVQATFQQLQNASQRHLRAFRRQLGRDR